METSQAGIDVLFWIFLLSLGGVIAAIVALVRSDRAVPPPMSWLPRRRRAGGPPSAAAPSRHAPSFPERRG